MQQPESEVAAVLLELPIVFSAFILNKTSPMQ
jgi:hypothetical protein